MNTRYIKVGPNLVPLQCSDCGWFGMSDDCRRGECPNCGDRVRKERRERMGAWTHNICTTCWDELHPDEEPARMKKSATQTCCFCGNRTHDGIFIRHDPVNLKCKGEHF